MRRAPALIVAGLLAAGCGEVVRLDAGPGPSPDAMPLPEDAMAQADTGVQDADGGVEAGLPDAEPAEAGPPDADPADTGADDAEPADTGETEDAGELDAGPTTYRLTVVFEGDGQGDVLWPDTTTCNSTCGRDLPIGSQVNLTARPGTDAVLGGWSPAPCDTSPDCAVNLDMDREVRVRFDALHDVTVTAAGDGLGRIDGLGTLCAPTCTVRRPAGATLALSPSPATGTTFGGWTGACAGQSTPCNLTVTGPTTITPDWSLTLPQLTQAPGGHFCALLAPRSVRCWGDGVWGQLGRQSSERIGDDETIASQGDLPLGIDVVQIAVGGTSTCVLDRSGGVRCWGFNNYGQLGQGSTTSIGQAGGMAPANVPNIDLGGPALQVAVGGWHACALMATGHVRCWGRGLEGQLGYGNANNVSDGSTSITSPALAGDVDLGMVPAVVSVAAGAYHSCAILEGGALKCWGSNDSGELGYPFGGRVGDGNALRPLPRDVSTLPLGTSPIVEVSLGTEFSCARRADGTVKCWGKNDKGQLGNGDLMAVGGAMGRPLTMGSDVALGGPSTQVRVAADHACAIVAGSARCWGAGDFGKLGSQSEANRSSPTGALDLGSGRVVRELGLSGRATCAVQDVSGSTMPEARCWGWGGNGGLGAGNTANAGHAMGTMPPPATPLY